MRRNHNLGMSPVRAGLLTLFLAAIVVYFGFTKAIPFRHHFEIQAVVTLRINDNGQPIHRDATIKIRPRLFLEGNFYVDLQPGTPSAGKLDDRGRSRFEFWTTAWISK